MVVIRALGQADLDAAFALDQICFPPGIAYSQAELRYFAAKTNSYAIVAEKAGRMAGFLIAEWNARTQRKPAHVVTIDVNPAQRRSGVATRLMDTAEAYYLATGCSALSLEVAVDNVGAQSFYAQRGFIIAGRRAGYYNDVLDAFTMRKLLAHK